MKVLLLVYDNESLVHVFPQGTAYVASALREAGHDVGIWSQDVHHWPEEHLTKLLDVGNYDVVGLGFIAGYWQYKKVKKIAAAVNASENRAKFFLVLGGHGPSAEPEFFLEKLGADCVVVGEGEGMMVTLAHDVGIGLAPGRVVNARTQADIDLLPRPAYDLFPIDVYRLRRMPHASKTDFVMPVLTSRGCPYSCNFCYRMDSGYRMRNPWAVIDEVHFLQMDYGINYVYFSDELLMSSRERIEHFCHVIQYHKVRHFKWFCSGRLNFAKPELLEWMKACGCVFVNYGIEAFDDEVLENMGKHLTCEQIENGIKATLDAGISPGFNIIWGNVGDTKETLQKGLDFLLAYDDHSELRTIRPVTPYPGSALYDLAIEKGMLEGPEDFYERKHVNSDLLTVNFTDLSDERFHHLLMLANQKLIRRYHGARERQVCKQAEDLYENKDVTFRGFRQT